MVRASKPNVPAKTDYETKLTAAEINAVDASIDEIIDDYVSKTDTSEQSLASDLNIGGNKLKTTDLLIKQADVNTFDIKDVADSTFKRVRLGWLYPQTAIQFTASVGDFYTNSGATAYYNFNSHTGAAHQVVAKAIGGYFDLYYGRLQGNLDANTKKIIGLATCTAANDAANKDYVDTVAAGTEWQEAVIDFYDPTGGLPGSPITGDRYISEATANGWTIHYLYEWNGASWDESVPSDGWTCWQTTPDELWVYNGSIWVQIGAGTGDHGSLGGLGDDDHNQYYNSVRHTLTIHEALGLLDTADIQFKTGSLHAAADHQSGGSLAVKLDDFGTPDDNTDLNVSTTAHGLTPKLSNNANEYLNGQGGYTTPGGAGKAAVKYIVEQSGANFTVYSNTGGVAHGPTSDPDAEGNWALSNLDSRSHMQKVVLMGDF